MTQKLLIVLIFFGLMSCTQKRSEEQNSQPNTDTTSDLPYSTGNEFDILIVGEDIKENESLQKILDSIFMQEIPILPQPEKLFIPTYVNLAEFDEEYRKFRNILIIKSGSTDSQMDKFEKESLPENLIREDKKQLKHYITIEHYWAKPQLIVYLTAADPVSLREQILEESSNYISQFDNFSKERLKTLLYNMGENNTISSELYMKHSIGLRIPKRYRIAKNYNGEVKDPEMDGLDLNRLFWIRDEQGLPDINILTYSRKLTDSSQLKPDSLVVLKNRVTKAIVEGSEDNSYIAVEKRVPMKLTRKKINDYRVIEIRGLWQTVGDEMGGPFIYYVIPDWKNHKIYYIDAFVFAPNMAKKLPVQTLEVIISSLNLGK